MMLTMLVSLYTSRVVLNTLGVIDYGTYNVIGGVVSLLSIMTNSMSSAISRYLTFELGKGFSERLEIVFSTSLNVQFILSFFSFLFMELLGVWFLNTHINIPKDRLFAANCVLQFSIVTFVINLISVPYNAAIVAHEKMGAFAYIGIMEVLLKLCCVIFLFFINFDKLIMWGFLLMISSFFVRIVYGVYCGRTFSECRYRFIFDKSLLKSMTSFAGIYYLLHRPPHFGKSFFLSEVENYFKENHYPVLRLDMGCISYNRTDSLESILKSCLDEWERYYLPNDGCEYSCLPLYVRFSHLIKSIREKENKEVVVLVDDYDQPLHDAIQSEMRLNCYLDIYKDLFFQLNLLKSYLRFVLFTGVSNYVDGEYSCDMSFFEDISLSPSYSSVCGYTNKDITDRGIINKDVSFCGGYHYLGNKYIVHWL